MGWIRNRYLCLAAMASMNAGLFSQAFVPAPPHGDTHWEYVGGDEFDVVPDIGVWNASWLPNPHVWLAGANDKQIAYDTIFAVNSLFKWWVMNPNYYDANGDTYPDNGVTDTSLNIHWVENDTTINNVHTDRGSLVLKSEVQEIGCHPTSVYVGGDPANNVNLYGCTQQGVSQQNTGDPFRYKASGAYITAPTMAEDYGYIEARIRIPEYSLNSNIAFWLYGSEEKEDINGNLYHVISEIDIFEMLPGKKLRNFPGNLQDQDMEDHLEANPQKSEVHDNFLMSSNIHGADAGPGAIGDNARLHPIADYSKWHTYACEWSPDKIIIYVDDRVVRTTKPVANEPVKMEVKFSIGAAGGELNDIPDMSGSRMEVDYVRYWRHKTLCSEEINTCQYDFQSHLERVYKNIAIGCLQAQNNTGANQIFLRAGEGLDLHGDLEIPLGAEVLLSAEGLCKDSLLQFCGKNLFECNFNQFLYQQDIRRRIHIGGGCNTTLFTPHTYSDPVTSQVTQDDDLNLKASQEILLYDGVEIKPSGAGEVNLLIISPCP